MPSVPLELRQSLHAVQADLVRQTGAMFDPNTHKNIAAGLSDVDLHNDRMPHHEAQAASSKRRGDALESHKSPVRQKAI